MAYHYDYPYTDTSRVNSDWFIETAKRIEDVADGVDDRVHAAERKADEAKQDAAAAQTTANNAGDYARQVFALAQVTENEVEEIRVWNASIEQKTSATAGEAVRGQFSAVLNRINDIRMLIDKNGGYINEALIAMNASKLIDYHTDSGTAGCFDVNGIKRAGGSEYKYIVKRLERGEALIVYTRGAAVAPLVRLAYADSASGTVLAAASEAYHTYYYIATATAGEYVAASYRQGEIANVIYVKTITAGGGSVDVSRFGFSTFGMSPETYDQLTLTYDGDATPAQFELYKRPATPTKMGLMSASDKAKLDDMEAGGVDYSKFSMGSRAQGNRTYDTVTLLYDENETPANFENYVRPATPTQMGLMSATDKLKLDSLTPGGGDGMKKVRIDFDGTEFTVAGEAIDFEDLYTIHITSPDFAYVVYDNRAYLLSYVNDGSAGTGFELRFESVLAVTETGGFTRVEASGIYVTSQGGHSIDEITITDVNSENSGYKATVFNSANRNSDNWYPSCGAVTVELNSRIGDIETALDAIIEMGETLL